GEWVNFYAPNDLIAYPLEPVHSSVPNAVRDKMVNSWIPWERWTPLAHSMYWKNRTVINCITDAFIHIVETINRQPAL
ncbi:MAG TPA: hypothetical protein VJZ27_10960, partial [Aggregatilineales bacterium]|nr:hypothetical protein [Aggregatilineales bacterium]